MEVVDTNDKVLKLAVLCHAANRAVCETYGDMSQLPWDESTQETRDSAMRGVVFRLENPTTTPRQQHEAWAADKQANGWVYGPTKHATLKTHPCLVPYESLPIEQQLKDRLFQAIVDTAYAMWSEDH